MRKVTALLVLGAMLAGCEGFYLATPSPQTWIGISGPGRCQPPEEMSLEIDGSAWSLDPMPATVSSQSTRSSRST